MSRACIVHVVLLALSLVVLIGETISADPPPGFNQQQVGSVGGITRAWAVGVADVNEDAIPDILAGNTYGDVYLLTGVGDGTFANQGVVINAAYYDAFAIAVAESTTSARHSRVSRAALMGEMRRG